MLKLRNVPTQAPVMVYFPVWRAMQYKYYSNNTSNRKKLIILGTGWGSYSVLKNIDKNLYDVVVVSPRNHFLFTPLLCSTTVGTLEFRSIIEPVRNSHFRNSKDYHFSSAVTVDADRNVLLCKSEVDESIKYELHYDKLVIGVGAVSNTFGVPGVMEHGYFLKEIKDARKIRNRIINNFELAVQPKSTHEDQERLLHIVIVGGGPTGVEFGAEVYDFLKQDVSFLYGDMQKIVRVTLIEANHILASFDKRLRDYAEKKISKREQFELLQATVAEVKKDRVILTDGKEIPCGLVVWSTGLSPRNFTKRLPFPKNKQHQLVTDEYLSVEDTPVDTVYALGDCAEIAGNALPSTAQVAERQGRWLARYLSGKETEPFKFQNMGMLAYVGGYSALTDMKLPHSSADIKLKGFHSWILWRSAYLTRLGSWKLRMQVPVDWMKTFFFGRDSSQF